MAVSGHCLIFLAIGSFPENDTNIIKYSEYICLMQSGFPGYDISCPAKHRYNEKDYPDMHFVPVRCSMPGQKLP